MFIGPHITAKGEDVENYVKAIKEIPNDTVVQVFIGNPHKDIYNYTPPTQLKYHIKHTNKKVFTHARFNIDMSYDGAYHRQTLTAELNAANKINAIGTVMHLNGDIEFVDTMRENIVHVLSNYTGTTMLLFETSSGHNPELFNKIEDLAKFYHSFPEEIQSKIGFCVDTCHIFAAGYNIAEPKEMENFIRLWNKLIGLDKIKLIHLNDSKYPCGSSKDEHAVIDSELGLIGSKGLMPLIKYAARVSIPMILERSKTPDNSEIEYIKNLIVNKK